MFYMGKNLKLLNSQVFTMGIHQQKNFMIAFSNISLAHFM